MDDKFRARFWAKVDKSGGADACWPWQAGNRDGYGQVWAAGKWSMATHWAVRLDGREVPAGGCVLHKCDNPPCVNPAHLMVGTQADNVRDCAAKGRIVSDIRTRPYRPRGELSHTAKATAAEVLAMRAERAAGATVASIARGRGLSWDLVWRAVTGQTWTHLNDERAR